MHITGVQNMARILLYTRQTKYCIILSKDLYILVFQYFTSILFVLLLASHLKIEEEMAILIVCRDLCSSNDLNSILSLKFPMTSVFVFRSAFNALLQGSGMEKLSAEAGFVIFSNFSLRKDEF